MISLKENMDNINKIRAIREWQKNKKYLLKCEKCGQELKATIFKKELKVVLICCNNHIQKYIPNIIFAKYEKNHKLK